MTGKELLDRYAAGQREFIGVDYTGATFINENLQDIILLGSVFVKADFYLADLKGSVFTGSIFCDADFGHADLRFTRLDGADFTGANFDGTIFDPGTKEQMAVTPKWRAVGAKKIIKRINIDFAECMLEELDAHVSKLNISRQACIKMMIRDRLDYAKGERK